MAEAPAAGFRSPLRRHERRYFYKYMPASTAKIVLANRTRRWSSPVIFNDPFDNTQELRVNFTDAELQRTVNETLARLIETKTRPNENMELAIALLLAAAAAGPDDKRREVARQAREQVMPAISPAGMAALRQVWREEVGRARVFCVSELNDIAPMWNHYADQYRGVVMEFEVIDELDPGLLLAQPIVYQDEPPAISSAQNWADSMLRVTGSKSYAQMIEECQYIKSTAWAYEKEWRVVSRVRPGDRGDTGTYNDIPFRPRELSAVFFGSKCGDQDRADIQALLVGDFAHAATWRANENAVAGKFTFERFPRAGQAA
ncbi:MAG: DUF2971 domain-containing protein [Elusimicrobiota bacterium]|nr:DUF2971 domain-containing protein [Elusimicrobiota bacterium]